MSHDTIRIVYDRASFAVLRIHSPEEADELDLVTLAPGEGFVDAPGPGCLWTVGDPTAPMAVPSVEAFQAMMLGGLATSLAWLPTW